MFQKLANWEKTRKMRKEAKNQIDKMSFEDIEKMLSGKNQNKKSSNEVLEVKTQKVEQTSERMSSDKVVEKFGNKIIFRLNSANGNYHADKGMIDGKFMDLANETKLLNVARNRVFLNEPTPLRKSQVVKYMSKRGFEVEFSN